MEPRRFVPKRSFPNDLVLAGVGVLCGGGVAVWRGYTSTWFLVLWGVALVLFVGVPLALRVRRGLDTIDIDANGMRVVNRTQTWHLAWQEIGDVSTSRNNGTFLVVQPRGAFVHKTVRLEGHEANEQTIFDTIAWWRGAAYQQSVAMGTASAVSGGPR